MAFCNNCGSQIPDGSASCPICGSVIYEHMNQGNTGESTFQQPPQQNPYGQQTPYQQPQQNPYGQQTPYQMPQQNPYGQQTPYQQPQGAVYEQAKKAKTLGILSIVFAIFSPLICWILSGIGSRKAKEAIQYANQVGDPTLLADAEKAKKLCTIGAIAGGVLWLIGIIAFSASSSYDYMIHFFNFM